MRSPSAGGADPGDDPGFALGEDILKALASLPTGRGEGGLLLAVSGGPDSLALLLAAARLRSDGRLSHPLHVASVDHALRLGSADETREVARICAALGLPHRTLLWRHEGCIEGNLSAAARAARYRLLAQEARRVGAGLLATAHHRDDQIETHRLALQRGASGVALAGMRPWRDLEPGLVLVRPLLNWRKTALEAFVRTSDFSAADDPSNRDPRFARARLRMEGLDAASEREVERALAAAEAERRKEDERVAAALSAIFREGRLDLTASGELIFALGRAPLDTALLSRAVTAAGGGEVPPRRVRLDRLAERLHRESEGVATLGGSLLRWREGRLALQREYGRAGPPDLIWDAGAASACFDGRFDIAPQPGSQAWALIVAYGRWGRWPLAHRALPVALGHGGEVLAAHPSLRFEGGRAPPPLSLSCRILWRLGADLVLSAGSTLTCGLQNAANRGEPVGKGVASTYIRRQVKAAYVA